MIRKQEILELATQHSVNPMTVDKDYVLGWVLAGIHHHALLGKQWVFKGGTCLKKCYFETYRFSEDLDFTLKNREHLDSHLLFEAFREISQWIYGHTGIEIFVDRMRFDRYANPRGHTSYQGRLYYQGPASPTARSQTPRIKLDLTADEILVDAPILREIHHNYSDRPAGGMQVLCYNYAEVFAEKTRALGELTRPRDLYDVVNLYRRPETFALLEDIHRILVAKCSFKEIPIPTLESINDRKTACVAGWGQQLRHQLSALPPFDSFWSELKNFFSSLSQQTRPPDLDGISLHSNSRHIGFDSNLASFTLSLNQRSFLERLRFGAANRLCVEVVYQKESGQLNTYVIKPYSIYATSDNNLLIRAIEHSAKEPRSFHVDRLQEVKISEISFEPNYQIEFLPTAPKPISKKEKPLPVQ
jgi:predicted nucleotidyltransferase component of viral defense system